ncbi:hypothetical protein ACCO45_012218 [Purpureocillium lilacinum]|uniref:Uncharacterized protein n=1 Tax=Purpureocillium lilacinum TaxID=33203 RepID=A0ACC4DD32_PURLI
MAARDLLTPAMMPRSMPQRSCSSVRIGVAKRVRAYGVEGRRVVVEPRDRGSNFQGQAGDKRLSGAPPPANCGGASAAPRLSPKPEPQVCLPSFNGLPAALTNDGATITYTSGESGASSVCRGIKITLPSPRSSTTRNHPLFRPAPPLVGRR